MAVRAVSRLEDASKYGVREMWAFSYNHGQGYFPRDMGMIFADSRYVVFQLAVIVVTFCVINETECVRNRTRINPSHTLRHIRNRPPSILMVEKDNEFLNKGKSKCYCCLLSKIILKIFLMMFMMTWKWPITGERANYMWKAKQAIWSVLSLVQCHLLSSLWFLSEVFKNCHVPSKKSWYSSDCIMVRLESALLHRQIVTLWNH